MTDDSMTRLLKAAEADRIEANERRDIAANINFDWKRLRDEHAQLTAENAELKVSEEMVSVAMGLLRDERDELRANLNQSIAQFEVTFSRAEQAEAKAQRLRNTLKILYIECTTWDFNENCESYMRARDLVDEMDAQ